MIMRIYSYYLFGLLVTALAISPLAVPRSRIRVSGALDVRG